MEIIRFDQNEGQLKVKKRRRVVKLCVNCRERKTKCDFGRPSCSNCTTKHITPCVYQSLPMTTIEALTNRSDEPLKEEIKRLRLEILSLKRSRQNIDEDDIPIDVKRFQSLIRKKNRIVYFGTTSWRSFFHLDGRVTYKFISYFATTMKRSRAEWKAISKHIPINGSPLDSADSVLSADPEQLIRDLELRLPTRPIILEYLNSYFDGLWNRFLPIIDKTTCLNDFNKIFVTKECGQLEIKVDGSSSEYALLALLLMLLRIGLISESGQKDFVGKFLDPHDLLLKYIEKLLELSKFLQKATLPTLQTVFLLRFFKAFFMTDGDGGDGSNGSILFAICFEMAYCLGLHQDIDSLYIDEGPHIRRNLKNFWVRILLVDVLHSFNMGIPLHISEADLRVEFLDENDIIVKTILQMRKYTRFMQCPNITTKRLQKQISDLRKFSNKTFTPIFSLINTCTSQSSCELWCNVTEEVLLSSMISLFIQHGYQILYFTLLRISWERSIRYYNLSMKYCLTLTIANVELAVRAAASLANNPLKSFLAQIKCFVDGNSRQSFLRCFVFYLTVFTSALRDSKKRLPCSTSMTLCYKLSDLQNLAKDDDPMYDERVQPIVGFEILKNVLTESFFLVLSLKTNYTKLDPLMLTVDANDYGLFILLMSMRQITKMMEKDVDLSELLKSTNLKFDIIYDSFGDYSACAFSTRYNQKADDLAFDHPLWTSQLDQFTEKIFESNTELLNMDSSFLLADVVETYDTIFGNAY